MQRFFDVLLSIIAIVLLFPFFIVIVLILKFTGEGEIFYLQDRVGRFGKHFKVIKFTTMLKNSSHLGTGTITVKHDPRILPFGKFLRDTKINELPQLLNVLLDDMSLIGPRPQAEKNFSLFSLTAKKNIKQVRPGLSGIGSVFFRNEEELLYNAHEDKEMFYQEVIMPYKGDLEIWYIKNRTILLYFKLIILTLIVWVYPKFQIKYEKWFENFPSNSDNWEQLKKI